jgi:hypothetical protein
MYDTIELAAFFLEFGTKFLDFKVGAIENA